MTLLSHISLFSLPTPLLCVLISLGYLGGEQGWFCMQHAVAPNKDKLAEEATWLTGIAEVVSLLHSVCLPVPLASLTMSVSACPSILCVGC